MDPLSFQVGYALMLHFLPKLRNTMVSRCCVLLMILCLLDIPWILEQPASSVLQYHPDFEYLCKKFSIYRVAWIFSDGTELKRCKMNILGIGYPKICLAKLNHAPHNWKSTSHCLQRYLCGWEAMEAPEPWLKPLDTNIPVLYDHETHSVW